MLEQVGKSCVGCSACMNKCPRHCIEMKADSEGFLYPQIQTELCVQCGLCEKTCPVLIAVQQNGESCRQAWSVTTKDHQILLDSSSGGLFTALAQRVLEEGGCVFGAAFTRDFQYVNHVMIKKPEDLAFLRGSKYFQSQINDIYLQVQNQLREQRKVLFSGTPCQIAGLKRFLGSEYEHLLLVDVICHGVPSALLWQHYFLNIKNIRAREIESVNFRNKRDGWKKFGIEIRTKQGKTFYQSLQENSYMQMFLKDLCLRESCYHCKVKESDTGSDITIGDFWGVERVAPEIDNFSGVSLALIHTQKGLRLFDQVRKKMTALQVNYDQAINYNPAFQHSAKRPSARDAFYTDLVTLSWKKMEKKYAHVKFRVKVKRKLSASVVGKAGKSILNKLSGSKR